SNAVLRVGNFSPSFMNNCHHNLHRKSLHPANSLRKIASHFRGFIVIYPHDENVKPEQNIMTGILLFIWVVYWKKIYAWVR
ncbi:hypothetical protein LXA39_17630, partial [Erwinia amylovora]|uniref:hypothetical protein n=1 Tax=Erwinia amylovora TaxID=552 RepID=UPI0020C15CFC